MRIKFYLGAMALLFYFRPAWADHAVDQKQQKHEELSSAQLLGSNPLQGLKIFAIHPQYSIDSRVLRSKVEDEVSRELEKVGQVMKIKVPDTTGYGKCEARMTFFIKDISLSNGTKLPAIQTSLFLASSTIVKKTGSNCLTYIWSMNVIEENKSDQTILSSVGTVISQFVAEYQEANKAQQEKPIFYLYIE